MEANYDCCTHYKTDGYDDGYIMSPLFPVKVCRNCGEVIAKFGVIRGFLFDYVLSPFWDGKASVFRNQRKGRPQDASREYIRQQWRLIRGVNDSAERRI